MIPVGFVSLKNPGQYIRFPNSRPPLPWALGSAAYTVLPLSPKGWDSLKVGPAPSRLIFSSSPSSPVPPNSSSAPFSSTAGAQAVTLRT